VFYFLNNILTRDLNEPGIVMRNV